MAKDEFEEDRVSAWNEAKFEMLRLHWLQQQITLAYQNLLIYDPMTSLFNYQKILNDLDSFYLEISPRFKNQEKTDVKKMRKAIRKLMTDKPIHTSNTDPRNKLKTMQVNQENFAGIKDKIFELRELLEALKESHGYGTPEAEEEGL